MPHMGMLYGRHDLLERLTAYKVRPAPADPPGKFEISKSNCEGTCRVYQIIYNEPCPAGHGSLVPKK